METNPVCSNNITNCNKVVEKGMEKGMETEVEQVTMVEHQGEANDHHREFTDGLHGHDGTVRGLTCSLLGRG